MAEEAPVMPREEKSRRISLIHRAFTPNAPVGGLDVFAGRKEQMERAFAAVFSPGEHAVVYGERGVGKSSLANIIYDVVIEAGESNFIPAKVNCSSGMSFTEIWREVFKQMPITRDGDTFHLDEDVPDDPNSEQIRGLLVQLDNPSIIVIDEFDRVDETTATRMADTIKTLSDRGTDTTLVIVGVAESLDQLIREHESITRNLVQIHMPRMDRTELLETIEKGLAKAEMSMPDEIRIRIAGLSQGLPHYVHVLAKNAALAAVRDGRTNVSDNDYKLAIQEAVRDKGETLGRAYQKATHSPKKNNFPQVLLACAMAAGKSGFFNAKDVREPLRTVMHDDSLDIQAYIRHLGKFCDGSRGPVLKKEGSIRRFQYKFSDPLMQPYVALKGLADGLITDDQLEQAQFSPSEHPQLF
ncbi:MAG TPA: ATP-binding protein [Candidatus Dormibacteraeota bacterium]|nr:ATP-binding protein [Candidatus Dormibacteraeota bacterium]